MTIGSNYSMTYLKPTRWWMNLLLPIYRHQSVSIFDQYEMYGVRYFDLRITFDETTGHAVFKSVKVTFRTFSLYEILNFLDRRGDTFVRFSLEEDSEKEPVKAEKFAKLCRIIEEIYQNIVFFGGMSTVDGKLLYSFKNKDYEYHSMPLDRYDGWLDKIFPSIGARRHNGTDDRECCLPVVYRDYVDVFN